MKVLIVHNHYQDFGGEDVVFNQEVEAITRLDGYEVHTLTFKNKKGWAGLFQYFMSPWNIFAAIKFRQSVQAIKPDVVHIHNTQYACGPILIRTVKKMNVPVVMTLHNFRLLCPSATLFYNGKILLDSVNTSFPWSAIRLGVLDNSVLKTFYTAFNYWFHRKIGSWKLVDRYLVLSEFAKQIFLHSSLSIPETQFVVKPNFTDISPIKDIVREKYYLYIGRLSEEKGIVPLLEELSKTAYQLKIYGDGPLRNQVEEIVATCDNIEYHGFAKKEDLKYHLAKAEALIVPSLCYEGMPMNILEAYGLGTPVIANGLGILAEIVKDKQTGLLYDADVKNSIVETLTVWERLGDVEKNTIYENCRKEYFEKYTKEKNMLTLDRLYNEIVEK